MASAWDDLLEFQIGNPLGVPGHGCVQFSVGRFQALHVNASR